MVDSSHPGDDEITRSIERPLTDLDHALYELPVAADPVPGSRIIFGRYLLQEQLGMGGFGVVYRAYDQQLERYVAFKMPRPNRMDSRGLAQFLREARQAAHLDHPHVVPVYDAGNIDGQPYIVYKLIDGFHLREYARQRPLNAVEIALLVTKIADGLDAAHQKTLYHRDVKPSNILVDSLGEPFLADFGLAIREAELDGNRELFVGTLPYMAPEQIRGEGHRIDARTDIYGLGIILYELLTGCCPFQSTDATSLRSEILYREPRPPRQFARTVPRELEQICLKALSKRSCDRFATAREMADELRGAVAAIGPRHEEEASRWQSERALGEGAPAPFANGSVASSSQLPVRIIPRGLRSFGAEDTEFFLELVPGPRGRDGLPDSIRFWKTRIEGGDRTTPFPVGLIYGPSGCGKSSLLQAGLLPHLEPYIRVALVEATPRATESSLHRALDRIQAAVPADGTLTERLAQFRRGIALPPGEKLLIVIDQFEQWLHAHGASPSAELVQALRQCDGEHVQAILLVRDDFWAAVSRFMQHLEIHCAEGHNVALVDRFDEKHARRVLIAFGQAYGSLPPSPLPPSETENRFLDEAIQMLAVKEEIIPVQLSLFAQLVKGKPWTPQLLKQVGGMEGLGVTFLEDTFRSAAANPDHRLHQDGIRRLLAELLPQPGSDLKTIRPVNELARACGCEVTSPDFERVLQILDQELRIITPAQPWSDREEAGDAEPGHYQLAHDYLVPSLREWLTGHRRATWRGRAALRLEERAAEWSRQRSKRALPSFVEWVSILGGVPSTQWTAGQRAMIQAAGWHFGVHLAVGVLGVVLLAMGTGWGIRLVVDSQTRFARSLVDRLLEADAEDLPTILAEMAEQPAAVRPYLRQALSLRSLTSAQRANLHLALLPFDPQHVPAVRERALEAPPEELELLRNALLPYARQITPQMWRLLESRQQPREKQLRAAGMLATLAPRDPRWKQRLPMIIAALREVPAAQLSTWAELLQPLRGQLVAELRKKSLQDLAHREESNADASPAGGAERARTLALLIHFEDIELALRQLISPREVLTRAQFLRNESQHVGTADSWLERATASQSSDPIRFLALLVLATRDPPAWQAAAGDPRAKTLLDLYTTHSDPSVHAATGLVLRRTGSARAVLEADARLAQQPRSATGDWFVNAAGMTMVSLPPRPSGQVLAVASCETTHRQFQRFRPTFPISNTPQQLDCPVTKVSVQDAMQFCNWLTQLDGLPESEACYLPEPDLDRLQPAPDCFTRRGYRLPTRDEWMYLAELMPRDEVMEELDRVAQMHQLSYEDAELVSLFAWHGGNATGAIHRVGDRLPNAYGLFDVMGNAAEWQHPGDERAMLLGGHYLSIPLTRIIAVPTDTQRFPMAGFRVVCRQSEDRGKGKPTPPTQGAAGTGTISSSLTACSTGRWMAECPGGTCSMRRIALEYQRRGTNSPYAGRAYGGS